MSRDECVIPTPAPVAVGAALTAEEEHLWSVVARTVKPLRPGKQGRRPRRAKRADCGKAASPVKKTAANAPRRPRRRSRAGAAAPAPIAIARREKQQLARGRAAIDARIDLHGMTQAQAHGALLRFLHRDQAGGAKFVLVITGKGAPNAARGRARRAAPPGAAVARHCRNSAPACSASMPPIWAMAAKARFMCG